jgi:phage tail-like protein
MALKFRDDPYPGYSFRIEVTEVSSDGTAVKGSFAEASGLEVSVDPIDYRNGSEDTRVRKLPGLKKFTNITLKRGLIGDLGLWNWIRDAQKGEVKRASGSVVLMDETGQNEVMRWNFVRGWPCKWSGPGLNAKNNEVAMETLEICHEGLHIDGEAP